MEPQKMISLGLFLFIVIIYQIVLAGRDFIVTGILATHCPPDWRFHLYVLVTTAEVLILASVFALNEPNLLVSLLKFWTVTLTWIGGILDWLYFLFAKLAKTFTKLDVPNIPNWGTVWHWMPPIFIYITRGKVSFDHPTTKHWVAYTLLMWIPLLVGWASKLAGVW